MKKPVVIIGSIVFALLVAGAAFWGGMNVGKAQAQDNQNNFFASRGFNPNDANGGGGGFTGGQGGGTFGGAGGAGGAGAALRQRGAFGTISKIDGNTITLTDNQGTTTNVTLSASTQISK